MSKKAATDALLGAPVSAGADGGAAPKKKKVKKESGDGEGGAAPTKGSLEKRLLKLLAENPKGMLQDDVCSGLKCQASDLLGIINELLGKHRIELLQDGAGQIFYKQVSADKVEKLRGLSPADIMIYQLVEQSSSQGIWIKDLRRKSGLPPLEIPKILKELQRRRLIKCERSIQVANKKVYMLYDIEPSRDVSGGAWYDKKTGEFDTEYMASLETIIVRYLERRAHNASRPSASSAAASGAKVESALASPADVERFLAESGAFSTVPSVDEVAKILQGLVYEGRVQRVEDEMDSWEREEEEGGSFSSRAKPSTSSAAAAAAADEARPLAARKRRREEVHYLFRVVKGGGAFASAFSAVPCATCPIREQCHEGNPISPANCLYLTQWLNF